MGFDVAFAAIADAAAAAAPEAAAAAPEVAATTDVGLTAAAEASALSSGPFVAEGVGSAALGGIDAATAATATAAAGAGAGGASPVFGNIADNIAAGGTTAGIDLASLAAGGAPDIAAGVTGTSAAATGTAGAGLGISPGATAPGAFSGVPGATAATAPTDITSSTLGQNLLTGPGGSVTNLAPGATTAGGTLSPLQYAGLGLSGLSAGYGIYTGMQLQELAKKQAAQSDPFGPYRAQYATQLNALMANPSSVTNTPGYQFGQQQGEQGVSRLAAQQGLNLTPEQALAIQQFNQQYAGQQFQTQEQMLAQLAGGTLPPTSAATSLLGSATGASLIGSSLGTLGSAAGRTNVNLNPLSYGAGS